MSSFSECQIEEPIMNGEQVAFPTMSEAQFLQWQALLEERTGMFVTCERQSLLLSNLTIRMREINCHDFDEYLDQVNAKPGGIVEWSILLDRLMVQESRFYRNPESLALVQNFLVTHLQSQLANKTLNIWSVGCSTGEEPYTLAMLANDAFVSQGKEPCYGVTATDICLSALGKAREGVYLARKLSDLPKELLSRYFTQFETMFFNVADEIKRRVCFSMANMVDIDKSPLRNMDVIYCQNVLIYFRKERKKFILDNLAHRLAPGGMLVIGQGEAVDWRHPQMSRVANSQTLAFIRHKNH